MPAGTRESVIVPTLTNAGRLSCRRALCLARGLEERCQGAAWPGLGVQGCRSCPNLSIPRERRNLAEQRSTKIAKELRVDLRACETEAQKAFFNKIMSPLAHSSSAPGGPNNVVFGQFFFFFFFFFEPWYEKGRRIC